MLEALEKEEVASGAKVKGFFGGYTKVRRWPAASTQPLVLLLGPKALTRVLCAVLYVLAGVAACLGGHCVELREEQRALGGLRPHPGSGACTCACAWERTLTAENRSS